MRDSVIVRLIGVKKKKTVNGEAIKFLLEKTKGQNVIFQVNSPT